MMRGCQRQRAAGHGELRRRGAAILGLVLLALSLASGCSGPSGAKRGRQQPQVIDSPQNDRTLTIGVNISRDDPTQYLTLVFEVRDKASGDLLHRQQTRASSRMAWSMRWLDNNTIQLESSDVGTTCWQEQDDGAWPELPCP